MKITGGIIGIQGIIRAIHACKGRVAKGVEKGIKKAALLLQRESQKVVPVDTGNLKNSAFTRITGTGFQTKATVGYTAEYAIFVHERTELRHKPGKIAKFLEKPARDNLKRMTQIIEEEAIKAGKRKGL